ncbi:MAG: class II aldolase/adducin family protein [Opitutaceae bacterium]|nr:class II aldolase/adducin family protein [Opitutaceae bacterium]
MRKVITAQDIDAMLRTGEPLPPDAILTPSARDALARRASLVPSRPREPASTRAEGGPRAAGAEPTVPDFEFKWTPGRDPKTPAELDAFFRSPEIEKLKERFCDIGRRIWAKDFVDGNGGNLTVRVGDSLVLCTPTLISKGFMTPADMCLVDFEGRQLAGGRKRTSEVLTHLGIIKRQPNAKACVHAHPPHATAFAIAGVKPPSCLIPEAEVFLGDIGYARYETPGTPANADAVGQVGRDHQCVIMENHGVIVWGKDVEDAYWKLENVDSFCRTVWIASQLAGGNLHQITTGGVRELIALRQKLGMPDSRDQLRECELCDNSDFRPGVVCQVPSRSGGSTPGSVAPDPAVEALVAKIADEIMKRLSGG